MPISLLPQFFFISILSTIISTTNFTHAYSQCMDDQKTLLLELKNDLIFDSSFSRKLVQWNQTEDCCSWEGVECDGAGHVISLQLDDEAISGGIENSSSLFSLRYLEKLNLAFNDFYETQIPRGIHNLTYLTHLNLSYAGFGGQVPVELSLLRRLVSLDISFSFLKLEHPNLKMLLQNLTGLRELYLDTIDISAQGSEWCHVISSSLPDLRNLSLGYCNLEGPIPESFFKLESLETLSLSYNLFNGTFQLEKIKRLRNLTGLDLSYNNLTVDASSINSSSYGFPQLRSLRLASCNLHNFPDLRNQSNLNALDLSNNRIAGEIPSWIWEIGNGSLWYLNLSYNNLTVDASSINSSSYGFPQLRSLRLASCNLHNFPDLRNQSNLNALDLSNNRIAGEIPSWIWEIGNGSLWYLNLSYNNLTVDASSINSSSYGFPQLYGLGLASCNLHNFPDLRNQSYLYYLDLSNNRIAGEIPSWIWEIGNGSLWYLDLSNNRIAGEIPSWIWEIGNGSLWYLDLSNNRIAGEIPSWIWEIGNGSLRQLNLSCNLLVDLQKPYHIPSSLRLLDLHSNQLRGELPLLPQQAFYVDYSNNNFDKSIPLDINGNTSNLFFFSLANNSLSGAIPTSLCNSSNNLQVLDLSFNNLSGNIPPCLLENTENLEVLNLRRNNLSGDIPDKFSVNCSLKTLDLSNNNLGGQIPESLGNCKSLRVMNVGNNDIDDSFPCMLSSSLRVLVLRSNRLHGEVTCHESWPNLQIIDIASNKFSGNLHRINFSSWRGMMLESDTQLRRNHLGSNFLSPNNYYRDEVTLTIKGQELKLVKILEIFTSVDFSCNNFLGEIPDAIGDLSSLYLLNLSHNTLTGTIPKSLGDLRQLGSLDLSVNQLTGMIPKELAGLTFLSVMNLSYNKLVGVIPNGPQFQTFSPASFEGNTGLCGFPLNISCGNTDENDLSPHRKMEIEWDYVSAALGYVVGLGSFLWLLWSCQSLRQKYFEKVDQVLEKTFDRQDRKRKRVLRNRVRRQ